MPKDIEVLGLVTARGGSKSIPGKNVMPLAGKPLIAWVIEEAWRCELIDRIVLTTDCPKIRAVGTAAGAEAPFIRPAEFAQDDTPDLPVFRHALSWLAENEGYRPELIVHLRPTSPFIRCAELDRAVAMMIEHPEADSIRGVAAPAQTPYKMWRVGADGFMEQLMPGIFEPYNRPRQQLPQVYWQTGCIDVVRRATVLEKNSMSGTKILGYVMDRTDYVDIDTPLNVRQAEAMITAGYFDER